MLHVWKLAVFVSVVIWLTGCHSGPSSLPPSTTAYYTSPTVVSSNSPPATVPTLATNTALPVVTPALEPVMAPTNAPAVAAPSPTLPPGLTWPRDWVNAWIALESWGQFNGLPKPNQLSRGLDASYQLQTSNGPMTLKMGSHAIRYAGNEIWLGFTPKLIRGLPYIHSLDARKTLQPLLAPPFRLEGACRTVVIDAGHGGKDGGAKSCLNGELEKMYTLDCAKRLERLLTANGWTVIMTRTNDTYLTLPDRVLVAERAKADLFLSLHFNTGTGNGAQAGVETYCLTPRGLPSNLLREDPDDPRQTHPNNAFDEQNFQLAARVHRAVIATAHAPDRGVRRARFMGVLRGQTRPAVLIEAGYLTNPAEARKIATSAYRQALMEGIARALE